MEENWDQDYMDWSVCTTCSDSEDDTLQETDEFKNTASTVKISKEVATPDTKSPDIKKQKIIEAGKQEPVTQEDHGKAAEALRADSSTAKNIVSQILNPGVSKVQKKRKKKNLKDGLGPASKKIKVPERPQENQKPCISGGSSTNTLQTNSKPDITPLLSQFLEWMDDSKAEYAAEVPNLCTKCKLTFSSSALLNEHHQNVHAAEESFKCPDCNKAFPSPGGVSDHRIVIHKADRIYQCSQCNAVEKSATLLNQHYSTYHDLSKCPKCSKWLPSLELLKQHQLYVHKIDKLFTCDVCGETFINFNECMKHQESHTFESTGSNSTFKKPGQLSFRCPDCNKTFQTTGVLNQHYRQDHGLAKCAECSKALSSLVLLQKHKWDVHKLLTCAICRETFSNFNEYRKHRESHTLESTVSKRSFKKPAQLSFKCPDCKKNFPSTGVLNQHYRNDHGLAKCIECGKELASLVLLQKHKWEVHKLFTCAVCRETFINFNQYKKHRETHTLQSTVSNSTVEKPAQLSFRCPDCNKTYPSTGILIQHHRFAHGSTKCSECSEEFPSLVRLKKHKWVVHKLITCAVCRETFINLNEYKNHRESHTLESTVSNSTFKNPAKLSFKCPDCYKTFPSTGILNQHFKVEHGFAKCFECSEEFPSLVHLKKHKWDVHKLYTCAVCRETFINFNQYKKHRESHAFESTVSKSTIKNPAKLSVSNSTFKNPAKLSVSNSTFKNPVNLRFRCPDCFKTFPSTGILNQHYSINHGFAKCCECSEEVSSLLLLKKHKWVVHKLLTCAVCRETFINFNQYKKHRESHTFESTVSNSTFKNPAKLRFRCPDCYKTFPSTGILNQHYSIDHGFAKCCECSEEFSSLLLLKKHKWAAHKLLTCAICRETFRNFFTFRQHRESHTSESTFSISTFKKSKEIQHSFWCPDCNNTFPRPDVLDQHYSSYHGFAKCFDCREEFSTLFLLKKHKWEVHKLYTCVVCRETFTNLIIFKKHQARHTFECTICNRTFKTPALLRKHNQTHM